MNSFKNMFRRLARAIRRSHQVQKFSVWTRNEQGQVFSYDIRVVACMNRKGNRFRYLARFDRTRLGGSTLRFHRILNETRARELMLQAA